MANTSVECPRRVSYAGSTTNLEQKSRRVSYAGHSGANELVYNNSGKTQSDLLANNPVNHRASLATIAAAAAVDHQYQPPPQHPTTVHATSNSSGIQNQYSATAMLDGIIVSRGMDSNRNSRRSTRNSDDGFNCSQQSILSAMDRFVKSVNNMDSTVLIPSRLRDMDFDSNAVKSRPPLGLNNPDLYSFYNMLKDVKTELLWGSAMGATSSMLGPLSAVSGRSTPHRSHTRQPSDDSLGSTGSASDQDTDSDIDSVLTDRDSCSMDEQTSHIAVAFRYHLQGLHTILHQLADSADYLAARYQAEVDSSPL